MVRFRDGEFDDRFLDCESTVFFIFRFKLCDFVCLFKQRNSFEVLVYQLIQQLSHLKLEKRQFLNTSYSLVVYLLFVLFVNVCDVAKMFDGFFDFL